MLQFLDHYSSLVSVNGWGQFYGSSYWPTGLFEDLQRTTTSVTQWDKKCILLSVPSMALIQFPHVVDFEGFQPGSHMLAPLYTSLNDQRLGL